MSAERLQKVLARAGVASRRKVEELIREGRITVNGRLAEIGERADLAVDAVKVDGRRIPPPAFEKRYVLLNKPRKCVSTVSDPEGRPTVLELLPPRLRPRLKPVGRLDYDTEGLLILSDDGEFAHRVAHPRFGCTKTYEVKVSGRPSEATLARLRAGVPVDGRRLAPESVDRRPGPTGRTLRASVKNSWWTVVLGEGRTRQIREMFFRVGHPVQRLRRVAIGPLRDPKLPPGKWRELDEQEVALFDRRRSGAGKGSRGRKTAGRPSSRPAPPGRPKARRSGASDAAPRRPDKPGSTRSGRGRRPSGGKPPARGR